MGRESLKNRNRFNYILAIALIVFVIFIVTYNLSSLFRVEKQGLNSLISIEKEYLYTTYLPLSIGLSIVSIGLILKNNSLIFIGNIFELISMSDGVSPIYIVYGLLFFALFTINYLNLIKSTKIRIIFYVICLFYVLINAINSFSRGYIIIGFAMIAGYLSLLCFRKNDESDNTKYIDIFRILAGIGFSIYLNILLSNLSMVFRFKSSYQSFDNTVFSIVIIPLVMFLILIGNNKFVVSTALILLSLNNFFSYESMEMLINLSIPSAILIFYLFCGNKPFMKKIKKEIVLVVTFVLYFLSYYRFFLDWSYFSMFFPLFPLSIWCIFSNAKSEKKVVNIDHKQISESMELPGPEIPVVETRNSRKKVESKSTSVNTTISIPDKKILSLNPGDSPVQMSFTFQCINVIQTHGFTVYGRPQRLKDKMSFVIDADYNNEHYEFYCIFKGNNNEPEICLLDRKYPTFARI